MDPCCVLLKIVVFYPVFLFITNYKGERMKRTGKTHTQHSKQATDTFFKVQSQEQNEQSSFGSDFESANINCASTSKSASVFAENSSSSCTSLTAGGGNLMTTGARNSRGFHLIKTLEWQIVRYAPPSKESLIKIQK
jgi:hypothetical protein